MKLFIARCIVWLCLFAAVAAVVEAVVSDPGGAGLALAAIAVWAIVTVVGANP